MNSIYLFQRAEEVARKRDCTAVMAVTWEEGGLVKIAMGRLNVPQNDPRPPQIKALFQRLGDLIETDRNNIVVIAMKGMALDHEGQKAIKEAVQEEIREE